MELQEQRGKRVRWSAVLTLVLTILGLLFGDNLCERYTGRPIFPPIPKPSPPAQSTTESQTAAKSGSASKSTFAVLVGVTDNTEFSMQAAKNYAYVASVNNVDEAIVELRKIFQPNDMVYVVHVPDLRVTPGNPGSCKLYLSQVQRLAEYPLGWIIGGDNIVPDEFESGLRLCYGH